MRTCMGCGGVLGRDCFNEMECLEIYHRQQQEAQQKSNSSEIQIHELTARVARLEQQIEYLTNVTNSLNRFHNNT